MDTPILTSNPRDAWYARVFSRFIARSHEYRDLLAWMREHIYRLPLYTAERVLSVGAGTGELDVALAPMLPWLRRYTVVEPNSAHIASFRERAGDASVYRFHQAKLEDVELPRHDVTLVAHPLCCVDDRRAVLSRLAASADYLVIIHQSELGTHAVQRRFGDAATPRHAYSSLDILRDFEALRLPARCIRVDSHVDVRRPDGELIDFLLERPTEADERERVARHLSCCYPDGMMPHPVDIIVVGEAPVSQYWLATLRG